MKKLLIGMAMLVIAAVTSAQKDPVSMVFEKYAGLEGYTTISITGDMLNMMARMQEERSDTTFVSKLKEIRILVSEKGDHHTQPIDFRTEVYDKLNKTEFKEMVTIKQHDEDVLILVKENNGIINEMLIIVGGKEDNVLIQAKGDILLREMAEMADDFPMKGFEHLKKLEK